MGSIPPHVFIFIDSSGFKPPVKDEKEASEMLFDLIDKNGCF